MNLWRQMDVRLIRTMAVRLPHATQGTGLLRRLIWRQHSAAPTNISFEVCSSFGFVRLYSDVPPLAEIPQSALNTTEASAGAAATLEADGGERRQPEIGENFKPRPIPVPLLRWGALPQMQTKLREVNSSEESKGVWGRDAHAQDGYSSATDPEGDSTLMSAIVGPKNFDESRYVDMLVAEGFSREQAQCLLVLIEEAILESLQIATRSMVSKERLDELKKEADREYQVLRTEVEMMEKRDFAGVRGEVDQIVFEIDAAKEALRDELNRVANGIRLDVNLEKGRIGDELKDLDTFIGESEKKIHEEISDLNERMAQIQTSTRTFMLRIISGILASYVVIKATQSAMPLK